MIDLYFIPSDSKGNPKIRSCCVSQKLENDGQQSELPLIGVKAR